MEQFNGFENWQTFEVANFLDDQVGIAVWVDKAIMIRQQSTVKTFCFVRDLAKDFGYKMPSGVNWSEINDFVNTYIADNHVDYCQLIEKRRAEQAGEVI